MRDTSFELRFLRGGAWHVYAAFDDLDIATQEFSRLRAGGRHLALRIVACSLGRDGLFHERIVRRWPRATQGAGLDMIGTPSPDLPPKARRAERRAECPARAPGHSSRARRTRSPQAFALMLAVRAACLVGLGAGALHFL